MITASRLKKEQVLELAESISDAKEPFILQNLKDAIEVNFKTKHAPSNYADLLNITAKALAKLTKTHFNKTLSDLISERIIIEAKRELYLTNKVIKEIAYELGYDDEHYFSRFFKTNADISPQGFATRLVLQKLLRQPGFNFLGVPSPNGPTGRNISRGSVGLCAVRGTLLPSLTRASQ